MENINSIKNSVFCAVDNPVHTMISLEHVSGLVVLDIDWNISILSVDQEFQGAAYIRKQHTDRVSDIKAYDDQIITCSEDKTINVIDLRSNKIAAKFQHNKELNSVAKNDNIQASGDNEGAINFWDLRTNNIMRCLEEYHCDEVTSLDFFPHKKGHMLSGGADDHFCYFDLNQTDEEETLVGMLNLEQEIRQVGFQNNDVKHAYALTSINTVVNIDIDTFTPTNTWQYPNSFESDDDKFLRLNCDANQGSLSYFYKRDGFIHLTNMNNQKTVFKTAVSPKGFLNSVVKFNDGIIAGYDNGHIQYHTKTDQIEENVKNQDIMLQAANDFGVDSDDDDEVLDARANSRKMNMKQKR